MQERHDGAVAEELGGKTADGRGWEVIKVKGGRGGRG